MTIMKSFLPRKWGALLKVFLMISGLYVLYILLFYMYFGNTNSIKDKLIDWNNATGIPGQDVIASNDKVLFFANRPNKLHDVIVVPPPIKVGEIVPNCGLDLPCKNGEFAVHIYTGKDHNDQPRLCVDGKYILSKDLNGGGRGINVVVVDNVTRAVLRVSHYDTYEKESTSLETLLLTLRPGDILILLTFDEPTRKLSRVARLLLHELGSALIQNLSYRGSWYLVTQKGITGFSPFEELHLVEANGWSQHHDVVFCAPLQLEGQPIHPDPIPRENRARQDFCNIHPDFPHFCDVDVVNDALFPAPPVKHSAAGNRIFTIPVVIMSGENIQYLPLTLETLIRQAGVNPRFVVVYYLPQHPEVATLADLFGFMTEELTQSNTYCGRVSEAFETTRLLFPDVNEILFIGEGIILSPDFLFYMGQLLPLFDLDPTISVLSAWNDNGFTGVSGSHSLTYRVNGFNGIAFVMRKGFFKKEWCDSGDVEDSLLSNVKVKADSIVPDVSRVLQANLNYRRDLSSDLYDGMFSHERVTSYEEAALLSDIKKLHIEEYDKEITSLLSTALPLTLDLQSLINCASRRDDDKSFGRTEIAEFIPFLPSNHTGQVFVVYFLQKNADEHFLTKFLCRCFGLFFHPNLPPRGLYKNLLRFTWSTNQIILVGSSSPYYRHKLPHLRPLSQEPSPGHPVGLQQ